jgi:hypothetical protein
MAEIFRPTTECPDTEICPRCHRRRLVKLRSMARHSELEWFKCDGCEHVLTREPVLLQRVPDAAAAS